MPWFIVPRNEVHQSLMMVEAPSAKAAYEAVFEDGDGTEIELAYHHTLDDSDEQPELDEVEELTLEQAKARVASASANRIGDDAIRNLAEQLNGPEPRTVEVIITNRHGGGVHTQTLEFTDFNALGKEVDGIIDDLDFGKVEVELNASWVTSAADDEALQNIELGLND